MVFTRFVELGRVVLITRGDDASKIAVIVDVVDANRVLVDGPTTGVKRQVVNFKQLALTELRVEVPHSIRTGPLKTAINKTDIVKKWKESTWAKKLEARKQKFRTSDFERFKIASEKRRLRMKVGTEIAKLRKSQTKKAAK